jgi:hypothetical protein
MGIWHSDYFLLLHAHYTHHLSKTDFSICFQFSCIEQFETISNFTFFATSLLCQLIYFRDMLHAGTLPLRGGAETMYFSVTVVDPPALDCM